MRIQHNIPALNAYRSYTQNVAAMKKNLEKLSSGYRINRAGDDAAGLAISEKMRAQITGLEVAQKNAKDGISLVQTAEGAMTEVHDMLNRMYELAEQSANGTYDNETDRAQMQKEIQSLSDEINRIADSSNFNGIKLVDGSLSDGTTVSRTDTFDLPGVGEELGTHSVLHKTASSGTSQATFSIDLHDLKFSDVTGEKLNIQIGNDVFTLDASGGTPLDGDAIVAAFLADSFKDSAGNAVDHTQVKIGNAEFTATDGGNGRLTFTQNTGDTGTVAGSMEVSIFSGTPATTGTNAGISGSVGTSVAIGTAGNADQATVDFSGLNQSAIEAAAQAAGVTGAVSVKLNGSNQLELLVGGNVIGSCATIPPSTAGSFSFTTGGGTALGSIITANGAGAYALSSWKDATNTAVDVQSGWTYNAATTGAGATDGAPGTVTGDYNKSTTVIQSTPNPSANRLASTYFKLTEDMITDGASIKIGDSNYTFTTDASKKSAQDMVYIGDLDMNDKASLTTVAERLTMAAKSNALYTVGHDGNRITVTETKTHGEATTYPPDKYDLSTMDGIRESLGYKSAPVTGKSLTLQIGDTSDSYNKLSVSINDCHTAAMGIGDIDISTQDGASAAMKKIKNAINYVSDVRGDLGALQNRLDHTINNLSVMHENIQDAESTIRDVDIAEEMMAYTKNNILVQSSQAMLAQANQLPQGVLQLLQ